MDNELKKLILEGAYIDNLRINPRTGNLHAQLHQNNAEKTLLIAATLDYIHKRIKDALAQPPSPEEIVVEA